MKVGLLLFVFLLVAMPVMAQPAGCWLDGRGIVCPPITSPHSSMRWHEDRREERWRGRGYDEQRHHSYERREWCWRHPGAC